MIFENKECLFLLLLLVPYIIWYVLHHHHSTPAMQVSDTHAYLKAPRSYKVYLLHVPFLLRIAAFTMLVLVIARPQTTDNWQNTEIEGIDIMMAVDVSTSMLAQDLKPNRIEAAKTVAAEFINGRPNDNIGLTIFAGESFTQCPLTIDHAVLLNLFRDIDCSIAQRGMIDDGTAIGMGIANAVSRLKESKAKSKVVILLTDGSNNRGDISPLTAAEIAKSFGVRVYTVGVGTNGTAPYPVQTPMGTQYLNQPVEIDEATLTQIASTSGGNYFRAKNEEELRQIYAEIDKLEKTKLNVKEFSSREEEYQLFAWIALACVLLEVLLKNTLLKRIP
ncbi:MAG: VWA domain-containing protein [Bacteroidaceae bacterium]|nr:VWA domain-containing protein [Bacteroidaceae bacterium]MBQ8191788.1 VWA domain-containing protein [Bacteroidaceae bacterium]MBR6589667.1 VWA domain-containing protein [Bacteroidaceae bacterium]